MNLDRSPERLAETGAHLRAHGISFVRVPAVEGKNIGLPIPGIDPDVYRRNHGRTIRPGEVGCYLSHMKAMRTFLASSHAFCVILEDDATIAKGGKAAIDELVACQLAGFDIVRLQLRRRGIGATVARLPSGHRVRVMATRMTGSVAYILTRAAASRYLARLLPIVVPYDHAFDRPVHLGLSIGFVDPAPVIPAKSISTIEPPKPDRRRIAKADKVGVLGKIPVLRWRSETELARAFAASSEALRRNVLGRRTSVLAEAPLPTFAPEIEAIIAPVALDRSA
ncbi:MAG: glycosyltransferase family 25 protein [Hyphomicrobium sp.]|nr:glycosyltransferase family 25 protein [Hyphomicrobium sp.]